MERKGYHFFAFLSRMKHINRWGLMRNTSTENIAEHSHQVAVIAHALAVIKNTRFGGTVDADRVAVLALYHDATETITGDMPTPIKYFNPAIRTAYKEIEQVAGEKLVAMLPDEMRPVYRGIFFKKEGDGELWALVKAADKISAYIKCVEERLAGNGEFKSAERSTRELIMRDAEPCVEYFMDRFIGSYSLTLDEQD